MGVSEGSLGLTCMAYVDGACRGNPGPSGIGVVLHGPDGERTEIYKPIGIATNNAAEYRALIEALKAAAQYADQDLIVHTDSLLMARQMTGRYQVSSPNLYLLYKQAQALCAPFKSVRIRYLPREENSQADRLANIGCDLNPPELGRDEDLVRPKGTTARKSEGEYD